MTDDRTQPEALRLADALHSNDPQRLLSEAAAKLCRLHAENERLRDAAEMALSELRRARVFVTSREKMHPTGVEIFDENTRALCTALRRSE